MNILIKLTCLIGLVIAPILGGHASEDTAMMSNEISKEVKVEMIAGENDMVKATVTTTTTENGEEVIDEQMISGTEAEVKAEIDKLKDDGLHIEHNIVNGEKIGKEVKVEMTKNDDGTVKAIVSTTSTENGEAVTKDEIFEGTGIPPHELVYITKEDSINKIDSQLEKAIELLGN